MNIFIRAYRFLNIISVDVAAGAMVGALFFARIFDVSIKSYGVLSLGLTVWIIYTADHLLDAKKIKHTASTERHRFHQRNFSVLFIALIAACIAVSVLIFFIRRPVFIGGLILSGIVLIYLVLQRYLKFMKEFAGALLYSGGVILAPLSLMDKTLSWMQSLLVMQFVLTALINLILFSWFDKDGDEHDKHQSFTTIFGEQSARHTLIVLFAVNLILLLVQCISSAYLIGALLIGGMNIVLFIIFLKRNYFIVNDRYRLWGDAVFLLPVIYLLF